MAMVQTGMPIPAGSFRDGGIARRFALPGGVYNATPARIVFGSGTSAEVTGEVLRLGARRALVVSTPGRGDSAAALVRRLGEHCAGLLPEAISQVPVELAVRGRARVRELRADCLVSFGGGAAIGLGKAISLELGLPVVAIPTTYSGSEMTGFCGITIDGVKRMHTSLDMLADTVIYDPDLTLGLPVDVSAASAMNALAHCVDAVYVPTVSPVIAHAAAQGAGVIAAAARAVVRNPQDRDARADLLYGACLGGAALTGGFALQHGLAHTLGGSFGVPHGLSHAIILPHVAAWNARHAGCALDPVARALGADGARAIGAAIFDLLVELGLPTRLDAVGIGDAQVEEITRITVETDEGHNPAPVTHEVVAAITRAALHGERPRAD